LLRLCDRRHLRANERGGEEVLSACGFHGGVLSVVTALRDTSYEIRDTRFTAGSAYLASRIPHPVLRETEGD